ncbi:MAG: helix-hairpin-helix domain-containing protein [Sphingobacteriales bacterium]|nr:helix-hairpin-helix domain-containing protein [Sphingobacteriales bacterium]MBI3718328.1 helix-hairpin-helix domain-containing protein [Sphingobacteriales bacterium]
MKKEWIKDYFTFTKKERIGVLALIAIILMLVFIPYLFPYLKKKQATNKTDFEKEVAKLKQLQIDSSQNNRGYTKRDYDDDERDYYQPIKRKYEAEENIKGELFVFDPNTATTEEWKRLGVKERTIQTIQNYLSKGGKFRQPEDLYKVYGLKQENVARMIPYVSIQQEETNPSFIKEPSPTFENKKSKSFTGTIEINSADTSALIALPGIGSKLSQRIISFRDKLGGFNSIDQVGETFGLPDSTFQKIKPNLTCNNSTIKKININTTDVDVLKAHPYIRYALANVIIQYRTVHGNYNSLNDLNKISMMNEELFRKISPYLTTEK